MSRQKSVSLSRTQRTEALRLRQGNIVRSYHQGPAVFMCLEKHPEILYLWNPKSVKWERQEAPADRASNPRPGEARRAPSLASCAAES